MYGRMGYRQEAIVFLPMINWKIILLFCLFLPLTGFAQIVPVPTDTLRIVAPTDTANAVVADTTAAGDDPDEAQGDTIAASDLSGFHYKITADGTVTAGNVNRALIQVGSTFDWAVSRLFRFASSPSFAYGRQNQQLNEREILADFRTTFLQEKRFYYLGFGAIEISNLRKIRQRLTGGAGVGYKLISKKNAYLSVTNVLLYEYTDFITNTAEVQDINVLRNSTRIVGEYQWHDGRYSITHTAFFQPALNQPNLRWNGNVAFQIRLSTLISVRTMVQNSYESVVAIGRKNNDFRWTTGLVLEVK
ncbi:DUF481 domain-containing protein [Larkinella rosea]|uniref:DUF481 domain-containing protein n=2 Tax=Larkinella rosea TaxID=2025312 RepID=A0A3P1BFJ1_9BACT|nr:DUF481 domain-containing protein [Larkinella rosea]